MRRYIGRGAIIVEAWQWYPGLGGPWLCRSTGRDCPMVEHVHCCGYSVALQPGDWVISAGPRAIIMHDLDFQALFDPVTE